MSNIKEGDVILETSRVLSKISRSGEGDERVNEQ